MTSEIGQAPPLQPNARDADALLLDFVRDRDVNCPRCGYNLRNLSTPVCPECKESLKLQVGAEKIRLFWLLITLAPGAFCGIALALIATVFMISGPPPTAPPPPVVFAFSFMGASALFTIAVALRFRRFLLLALMMQFIVALAVWAANMIAFGLFVLFTV